MGQRGAQAAFMPSKFVFPGGAVDPTDGAPDLSADLSPTCRARLTERAEGADVPALIGAGIRELWEETGLRAAQPGPTPTGWAGFDATPSAKGFTFFFRAITPPGRPRRFDARFFLARATSILDDPEDFSRASDELSHLHWSPLTKVRRLNLPFITEVVLAELATHLAGTPLGTVPFFDNSGPRPVFRRLGAA